MNGLVVLVDNPIMPSPSGGTQKCGYRPGAVMVEETCRLNRGEAMKPVASWVCSQKRQVGRIPMFAGTTRC